MNDSEATNSDTGIVNFQFGVYGVVAPTICILGIIGNVLAVIVLSRRRMRSSMSCYLIAQAVFDCIVLIMMILSMTISMLNDSYRCVYPYLNPVVYPLALIGQTGTIYITVSFTVERYIAVCRPLQASNMCTPKRAIKVSLLVSFVSILYNVPRMMEKNTFSPADLTRLDNETHNCPEIHPSKLGNNVVFLKIYRTYMYLFFIFLLPFLLLFTLNILLLRAVKDSQRARNQMNARTARENNLTIMVIVVVIVFLVCQLPALIDNIFVAIVSMADLHAHWFFTRFTTVSNLLVAINSAINFLLYCVFGNKFRRVFLQIFCGRKSTDRSETSMQMFRTTNRQTVTGTTMSAAGSQRQANATGSRREHNNVVVKQGLQNNNHVNGHATQFIDADDVEIPVDNDDPRRRLITTTTVATDDEV
ncbi:FMRFamide receptor-like [Tubulanus polymorphus]|uniref:FMRFamide receptor-like n=1 Tax=Tubulanus polymorphus TaxID=672921 RepID=UPI003DA5BD92